MANMLKRKKDERKRSRNTRVTAISLGKTFISSLLVITLSTMSYSPAIAIPADATRAISANTSEQTNAFTNATETALSDSQSEIATDGVTIPADEGDVPGTNPGEGSSDESQDSGSSDNPSGEDSGKTASGDSSDSASSAAAKSGESEQKSKESASAEQAEKTLTGTLKTAEGAAFSVTVKYDAASGIPEGSSIDITEWVQEPSDPNWRSDPAYEGRPLPTEQFASKDYLAKRTSVVAKWLDPQSEGYAYYSKFLNLAIKHNGKEVVPRVPVQVTIETNAIDETYANGIELAHMVYDEAVANDVQAVEDGFVASDGKIAESVDVANITENEDGKTGRKPIENGVTKLQFATDKFGEFALVGIAMPKAIAWQDETRAIQVLGTKPVGLGAYDTSAAGVPESEELLGAQAYSVSPNYDHDSTLWARVITAKDATKTTDELAGYALAGGSVGSRVVFAGKDNVLAFKAQDGFAFTMAAVQPAQGAGSVDADTKDVDEGDATSGSSVGVLERRLPASNGGTYVVQVAYDENSGIPEGASLQVRELQGAEYRENCAQALEALNSDQVTFMRALDIAFLDVSGAKIEPTGNVNVSITLQNTLVTGSPQVVHIGEEGVEVITPQQTVTPAGQGTLYGSRTLEFTAGEFSVYVVAYEPEQGHQVGVPQCTYTFHVWDDEMGYTDYSFKDNTNPGRFVTHQVITSGDELIVPQPASTSTKDFAGWYKGSIVDGQLTLAEKPYDFDNIVITENSAVDLYAVYKDYAYIVFHGQYDTASGTYPIAYTRRAELVPDETTGEIRAKVKVDDLNVGYNSTADEEMAFFGWSKTPIKTPGSQTDDSGQPVSKVPVDDDGYITVTESTDLYAMFKNINWLHYYTAQSGLSASYVAPAYYFEGDPVPTPLPLTSRSGYVFDGWYTGTLVTETVEGETVESVNYGKKIANADGRLVFEAHDEGAGVDVGGGELHLLHDATLYAKWKATYNIVTYKQVTTDALDLPDADKHYEYAETFTGLEPTNEGMAVIPDNYASKYTDYAINATRSSSSKPVGNGKQVTVLEVYYDRTTEYQTSQDHRHTLTFTDSVDGSGAIDMPASVSDIAYGSSLANYKPATDPKSDRKSAAGRNVYEFSGWYLDKECTIAANFDAMTMPDRDLTIYAGWAPIKFRVDIDPNYGALYHYEGGVLVGTGATYFSNTYGDEPIAEYTHVARDYAESSSGDYFYVNHDRAYNGPNRFTYYTSNPSEATEDTTFEYAPGTYTYVNWYEVLRDANGNEIGEASAPYDFSQLTDHDTKLRLHWKKSGVYYLAFNAGDDGGTLEDGTTKEEILPEPYSDTSSMVLTRSAIAPAGYAFVGWKVRGSNNELLYAPSQSFTLHAQDAVRASGKDIVYLDAVYVLADTASITYDANGGTIAEGANFGSIPGPESTIIPASGTIEGSKATVAGLVNNAKFNLSDGTGFSYTKDGVTFTLKGWSNKRVYDPDDDEAELYTLGGTYGVDTKDPTTLYAVWETTVTYYLNMSKADANWGGDWGDPYVYHDDSNTYTQNVYLGNTIDMPAKTPVFTGQGTRLFRYWATESSDDSPSYSFANPVEGALSLYANWGAADTVGVHVVDASSETLAIDPEGSTAHDITVGATEIALPGEGHASALSGDYELAFVATHDSTADISSISESDAVTAIKYDAAQKSVCVKYKGAQTFTPIGSNDAIYYVYYQKKALNIGYKSMNQGGALSDVAVDPLAPGITDSLGSYNMQEKVTAPLSWQTSEYKFPHYAFAIGSRSAANAGDLNFITNTSSFDADPPALQVRNTWRGFEYSIDGSTWESCGYNPQLYVVYYAQHPTVVTFKEVTVGDSSIISTPFTYNIRVTQPNGSGGTDTIYDTTAQGNSPYTLRNGEERSTIVFYAGEGAAQTIQITQDVNNSFTTAVSYAGTVEQSYTYSFTADGTTDTQTVTFTNTHKSLPVEVHVARIANVGQSSGIICNDGLRGGEATDYSFNLGFGNTVKLIDTLNPDSVYPDRENYSFGTVVCGTGESGQPVSVSLMDIDSVAYEKIEGSDAYGLVMKDAAGKQLGELGSNKLYYLYYPQPVIKYMKIGVDGKTLTPIKGSPLNGQGVPEVSDEITYNHNTLVMNDVPVVQNQKFGITLNDFVISQEGNNFRMPPILDDELCERYLSYAKIGAGSFDATSLDNLDCSDGLTMRLTVNDNVLQYSFDGTTWTDLPLSGAPTVYALYTERGYDLQISKTIDMQESGTDPLFADKTFTVTISSPAITESSYEAEGAQEATVKATPAEGTTPGTIVLTGDNAFGDGSKIRIKNLGTGEYTITEADNANYILSAKIGPIVGGTAEPKDVEGNESVAFQLDGEKRVELTNTPKAICKIGETKFYTLQSAIDYAAEGVSSSAEVEMLTDYVMPIQDVVKIPAGLDITLTTAEEGFVGAGDIAVITRTNELKDTPLFIVESTEGKPGALTIRNMRLEGSSIEATQPMIQSAGNLTIDAGATVQNAVNTNGNGGAINATGGDITVNGVLTGNSAVSGGAISYTGNGQITISDAAELSGNTASASGGAIYATGGTVTVTGTAKLSNNQAPNGQGGALYAENGVLSIEQNGKIENNSAKSGGAAYIGTGSITMSAMEGVNPPNVTGNQATTGNGGAFWLGEGSVSVSGGSLSSNEAAAGQGGAIYTDKASVSLSGTAGVTSNSAVAGGAVYANAGDVTVSGGSLGQNTATSGNGGAIYAGAGDVKLLGGDVAGNAASAGSGGTVYAGSGDVLLSSPVTLTNSTAYQHGGAVYAEKGMVTVSCNSLSGNTATNGNGGAIYTDSGTVAFVGVEVSNNHAGGNGGAVFAQTGSVAVVNGSFSGNQAGGNGGAICANGGDVTLSGTSGVNITQNQANGNGGAVYAGSGAVSVSNTVAITQNQAIGNGGALYVNTGTATLTGPTMSGNQAVNGSAVFIASGKADFKDGTYSANVASAGGAIGMNSTFARLSFAGNVRVMGNTLGSGGEATYSNVYLDQDSKDVLSMAGLGNGASLGIYVPDTLTTERDVPGARFATYTSDANVTTRISNDRRGFTVQMDTDAKQLFWGMPIKVEVRYQKSFANNSFPPTSSQGSGDTQYTVKKDEFTYYPEFSSAAISELASELYNKKTYTLTDTAVYGIAFTKNGSTVGPAFDDYITNLVWNSSQSRWEVKKRDGSTQELGSQTIVIYYSEPAYISIENNTPTNKALNIESLTVGGKNVINTDTTAGYGAVFARNGSIRTALLPISQSDLCLNAGESISLLIPGGQSMAYDLGGRFDTDTSYTERLRRGATEDLVETQLAVNTDGSFANITGNTLGSNATYNIIFGDDRYICKVVDSSGVEHRYTKISNAISDIQSNRISLAEANTATIEMLVDYLLPTSDVVNIPQGYDITLTTASSGTYRYTPAEGGDSRATISRDSTNMNSMINAWNSKVGGEAVTTLRLNHLVFDGKSVKGNSDGGAVASQFTNVYIDTVDFKNVYAKNGGALLVMFEFDRPAKDTKNPKPTTPGTVLEVRASSFNGCTSTTDQTSNRLGGGAIVTNAETMTLENCTFNTCSAIDQAGAVFHRVDGNYASWTNITGCSFINCHANAAGGLELDSKTINVTDTTFEHCVASARNGGGFNVYALNAANPTADCWVTVSGCTFNDCQLTTSNTSNGYGGGFRSNAVYTTVKNSTFTNNLALYGGGFCMSNTGAKTGEVYGCTFERNEANQGGGIFSRATQLTIGDCECITIDKSVVIAEEDAQYFSKTELDGKRTYVFGTAEEANAFKAKYSLESEVKAKGSEIKACASKNEGGGVYQNRDVANASLTINNSSIVDNLTKNSGKNGGGVFTNARTFQMNGATVTGNTATGNGGGIYANCYTSATVTNSTISQNRATGGSGGGLWFDYNNDTARASQVLSISGCQFDGDTASAQGGGIYTLAKSVSVTGSQVDGETVRTAISNCSALNGGGIYQFRNIDGSNLTIADTDISGCRASNGVGGGVYTLARTVEVTLSSVSGNTSSGNGGGICHDPNNDTARNAATLTIVGSTLSNNVSGVNGGGVYANVKTVIVGAGNSDAGAVPSMISGCTAASNGGGIYQSRNVDGSSLAVTGSTLSSCKANGGSGGGAYASVRVATFTDSEVTGNTSSSDGGGIYKDLGANNYFLVLDHTNVTGNTAGGSGGGVYTKSQLTLKNSTEITGNRLSTDNAVNAAGVFISNNRTLFIGDENRASAGRYKDEIIVRGNYTNAHHDSNLRLWEEDGQNKSTSVKVYCDLSGEIRVVNAKKVGTQFGDSTIAYPAGFTDDDAAVFKADLSTLHGIIDRTDSTGKKIIWAGPPICKITDGEGNILYLKNDGTGKAIFDRLDDRTFNDQSAQGKTSAFRVLNDDQPQLYTADGHLYEGTDFCVKMLVETFTTESSIFVNNHPDRHVTLTTAGKSTADEDGFPYQGNGNRATVVRGAGLGTNSFVYAYADLLLESIVIDGGSEMGITGDTKTRNLVVNQPGITATLGMNATLQNARSTGEGAGVYVDQGTFIIDGGGTIRNCEAKSGGGVYVSLNKNNVNNRLELRNGNIFQCRSTENGGGVYMQGGTFSMSGGVINRCGIDANGTVVTQNGGGVYVTNDRVLNISGGSITGCSANNNGGGIAITDRTAQNVRFNFSGKVNISGNTARKNGQMVADNVELNQNSKAIINVVNDGQNNGLLPGSYIGVYVPGTMDDDHPERETDPYKNCGGEKDAFGTFETGANTTNLYSFVNDRNGLKGGIIEDPDPNTIYWIQIFSLKVSKVVEDSPSNPVDPNEKFSFTVTISGTPTVPGQLRPEEIDSETGSYGEMEFHSDGVSKTVATFELAPGESITAVNLSEGLDYKVEENLTEDQKKKYVTLPATEYAKVKGIGENKGRRDVDPYTSAVTFTNILPVCKITDNRGNLLYREYEFSTGPTPVRYNVPAAYTDLTNAKGDGALEALWGDLYTSSDVSSASTYSLSNSVQIHMLAPNYTLPKSVDLPSSINGNAVNVTLTTAAPNAAQLPWLGTGAAAITRGFDAESMFTVHGGMTVSNVIIDGARDGYTATSNGGIMNVPNGGRLRINDGATLQNSKTSANGGALYVASGGVVTMSGGTIQRNWCVSNGSAVGDGAGVYLAAGSTFNLSGNPSFGGTGLDVGGNIVVRYGNYKEGELIGKTNGGKTYRQARQDIFIAEAREGDPSSLVIAGDLTGDNGTIWVWAASAYHNKTLMPFAKIGSGASITSANNLGMFRNALDDDASENETSTYLFGTAIGDVPGYVYWSGLTDAAKTILRKVNGDKTPVSAARFTLFRTKNTSSSPVVVNGRALAGLESGENGTIWVGELPYGEYYLYESMVDGTPIGRWFLVTVGENGVTCVDG